MTNPNDVQAARDENREWELLRQDRDTFMKIVEDVLNHSNVYCLDSSLIKRMAEALGKPVSDYLSNVEED